MDRDKKAYQVIEPVRLDPLMAWPRRQPFAVALLHWLAQAIRSELGARLGDATLAVIRVEYMGAYPALGIHHGGDFTQDIAPLVEETAARLIQERSLAEFIEFMAQDESDWFAVTAELMKPLIAEP